MAILHRRSEAPLLDSLNGFFIQAEAKRPHHPDALGHAVLVYDDHQHHGTLILGFPGLFGVFRLGLAQHHWRRDAAPNSKDAAAHAAARSIAVTVPAAIADTATAPLAHSLNA